MLSSEDDDGAAAAGGDDDAVDVVVAVGGDGVEVRQLRQLQPRLARRLLGRSG